MERSGPARQCEGGLAIEEPNVGEAEYERREGARLDSRPHPFPRHLLDEAARAPGGWVYEIDRS
jgi:hypothetical protein